MAHPIRISAAQDADAEYVLNKIASADRAEAEAKTKTAQGQQDRIDAGLRLIEVRGRWASSGQRACPQFAQWLKENHIPAYEASRLMKLAAQSDSERDAARAAEAKRKQEQRAAKAAKAPAGWQAIAMAQGLLVGNSGGNRQALRAELETVAPGAVASGDSAAITKACKLVAATRDLPAAIARTDAEVATLPEKAQVKFDRLVAERVFQIETQFWRKVNDTVKERLAEELAEAKETKELYENLTKPLSGLISKEEFRLIRSYLHSDKGDGAHDARRDRAFNAFMRLEKSVRW